MSKKHRERGGLSAVFAGVTVAAGLTIGTFATEARAGSSPYVGEMMAFGGTFCPRGWAETNGQILAINSNQALFSLLGTTFGGDGRTTFGLPELRGRTPVGFGTGPGLPTYNWGTRTGETSFVLNTAQMPQHSHNATIRAYEEEGDKLLPGGHLLAGVPDAHYSDQPNDATLAAAAVTLANTGGGQQVDKRSPMQVVRWCIALTGIFPPRN